MKAVAIIIALSCLSLACAQGQYGTYAPYTFEGTVAARRLTATPPALPDIPSTSGTTRFRTQNGDTLAFQSTLTGAVDITAVHLHLTPQRGVVDGGPLVIALTATSPLSSSGNAALVQTGTVGNAQLFANPQLQAARDGIRALGITDNALQNIGDIDRLARAGVLYTDVHSTTRQPPNRVGSGIITIIPSGRKRYL